MKITKTFAVDSEILVEIDKVAKSNGESLSATVTSIFKEWVKRNKLPQLIPCPICKSSYSERLPFCPNCDEDKIKENIKQIKEAKDRAIKDVEIQQINIKIMPLIAQKDRIMALLVGDGYRQLTTEETAKYQAEADKLTEEINKLNIELNRINNEP
jgi:hypothetical protein